MTSYSEFDDSSSDNTKCNRIMSDFQEFLKKQSSIGAFNSHVINYKITVTLTNFIGYFHVTIRRNLHAIVV